MKAAAALLSAEETFDLNAVYLILAFGLSLLHIVLVAAPRSASGHLDPIRLAELTVSLVR